jgi:electron transfer flavoprotein alpha subunit
VEKREKEGEPWTMSNEPVVVNDIWILTEHRGGILEEVSFGLLGEARRLLSRPGEAGRVTAVVFGALPATEIERLGSYGADRILYLISGCFSIYQGDLFARALSRLIKRDAPSCLLAAQTPENADLCPRVAALLETGLVTWAMDLRIDATGGFLATRPVANGYLFEEVRTACQSPPIIAFLPSVLTTPAIDPTRKAEAVVETVSAQGQDSQIRLLQVIEADPEALDLEEADVIVAGGRGVGKGEAFKIIHDLARLMGGSVAATRPVIDWQTLPYERQIGQTGKTVTPRLIINIGISGANEYTAGMEKSQLVIAINSDPRARIFRFADLAVVGNLHALLPLLMERIKETKESQ